MDANQYLRRIDSGPASRVDRETLFRLQRAHLLTVPFENLDIRSGRRLDLGEEALFDKIVGRRRGGICYEQNILFASLLRTLGFEVALLSAEVSTGDDAFGPPFDHMALLVVLGDRRFLVDVGFGDSFLEPLDLDYRGEQQQEQAAYEVRRDGEYHVVMQRKNSAAAMTVSYRLQTVAHPVADFHGMCVHHETSPDSPFTRKDVCSLATPTGRITISAGQLIETRGDSRVVTELHNEAERRLAF